MTSIYIFKFSSLLEQAKYNIPTSISSSSSSKDRLSEDEFGMMHSVRMESMRPRKRRQPMLLEDFAVDEGYTMEHSVDGSVIETTHNVATPKIKQYRTRHQNPFKLVRCLQFSQEQPVSLKNNTKHFFYVFISSVDT